MDTEPFLPFEDISLEGLCQPLKGRSRIQYTCFTVSEQFIMIGTNTGGVYVFHRKSQEFISILPGQAGGVNCLAVDGEEQLMAAGSAQGAVSVFPCPAARSWSGELVALARLDAEVQALCWRRAHWSGPIVYVGTAAGKVLTISVNTKKNPATSATITPMLQLDSAICELVLFGQTLLVSTVGFCYLCNIQMEVFAQVGTQPRSTRLGACFLGDSVFCARPGLRFWEVRLSGQIVATHQLRPALQDATPRRVVSACNQTASRQDGDSGGGKSALGLIKLVPFSNSTVAAFSGDAVFVLQPAARRIAMWTSIHGKVRDLATLGDELYVQCVSGALRRFLVLRPSQIVRELHASRGVGPCARFLMSHCELTYLCQTGLPLEVLRNALKELTDDSPMQTELTRLMAVLRDRLAEEGVEVDSERSAAPCAALATADEQEYVGVVRSENGRLEIGESTKTDDIRADVELNVSEKPYENRDPQGSMTTTADDTAEVEESSGASGEPSEVAENVDLPKVVTDESPLAYAGSSSEEFRSVLSSDHHSTFGPDRSASLQPPSTRPSGSPPLSGDVILFRSRQARWPQAWGCPIETRINRLPELELSEWRPHVTPNSKTSTHPPSHSPPVTLLQPPPISFEWHDSSQDSAVMQWRSEPAASQMGVYGYTAGLALQPEVLDAFSDLVDDVREVVSLGAQRLVHRLLRQSLSPFRVSAAPAAAAAPSEVDWPWQFPKPETAKHQQRSLVTACAAPVTAGGSRKRRKSCTSVLAEASLAELTAAAADTAKLSLPTALHWLDAVATMHYRFQPIAVEAVGAVSKTASEVGLAGGAFPALTRLCAEPDEFVYEGSFTAPIAERKQMSRLLNRTIVFLASREELSEELVNCAAAAPLTEWVNSASRAGSKTDVDCIDCRSLPEEGTVEVTGMVTASESGGITSGQSSIAFRNEFVEASSAADELVESAKLISSKWVSGIRASREFGVLRQRSHSRVAIFGQSAEAAGKPGAVFEDETSSTDSGESKSYGAAVEESAFTAKHADVSRMASLRDRLAFTDAEELRGVAKAPMVGSPAWLAEQLGRRLFYILDAADLRARLAQLPMGPRSRLWSLLLHGTEAHFGPFRVGPGGVATALMLAVSTELDWLSLSWLAVGLCRADPVAAAAFCIQHSDRMAPLDVLYVCRHAAAPGYLALAFSAYLSAATAEAAAPLLADAELAAAATAALSAVWRRQAAQLRCRCGRPRAGAHCVPRPAATLLRRLLIALFDGKRLSHELWMLGDFIGWLEVGAASAASGLLEYDAGSEPARQWQLATVVCQLDDAALLPVAAPLLSDWRPLLAALAAARPGRCCGCGIRLSPADGQLRSAAARQPLSLQMLLAFVTSVDGLEAALQLLQTASDAVPQRLSASCYRDVILGTVLNRRVAGLGASYGAHILRRHPAPVSEEVAELLRAELERPTPPTLATDADRAGTAFASLVTDCPACCLPLRNQCLLEPHGLLAFCCRHAFHAVCVLRRGAGCLLCRR